MTGEKLLMVNAGTANAGTGRVRKDIESILDSVSFETGIAKKYITLFYWGHWERLDVTLQATFIKCANLLKKYFKNFAISIMTTDTKLKIAKRIIKGSKKYSIVG